MSNVAPSMSIQDMVKKAMDEGVKNARINAEAQRQQDLGSSVKTASAQPPPTAAQVQDAEYIPTEDACKLASAIEYLLKQGAIQLPQAVGGGKVEPGKGPGALHVMETTSDTPPSGDPGKAHNQGPKPGLQSTHGGAMTQVKNDIDHPSPQKMAAPYALLRKIAESTPEKEKKESEGMAEAKKGLNKAEQAHAAENKGEKKEGSGDVFLDYLLTRPRTKVAEDATNPARIGAGAAVPPNTSASGESGGAPVGGQPKGPRHLIGSNQAAIDFTRRDAYGNRKSDLTQYLTEPALTSSTDKVLGNAFAHTQEAGAKIASAPDAGALTKVAAGRALLNKLAQAVSNGNTPARA